MQYPCMVYEFVRPDIKPADNQPYVVTGRWEIHHMYKSIKNDLKEKMIFACPYLSWNRRQKADGVYNDYYTLYK